MTIYISALCKPLNDHLYFRFMNVFKLPTPNFISMYFWYLWRSLTDHPPHFISLSAYNWPKWPSPSIFQLSHSATNRPSSSTCQPFNSFNWPPPPFCQPLTNHHPLYFSPLPVRGQRLLLLQRPPPEQVRHRGPGDQTPMWRQRPAQRELHVGAEREADRVHGA